MKKDVKYVKKDAKCVKKDVKYVKKDVKYERKKFFSYLIIIDISIYLFYKIDKINFIRMGYE